MFKDIKQGDTIYLFDRNNISMQVGKVTAVNPSHAGKYNNTFDMVVDLTINTDGQSQVYTFKDSNEVSYAGQTMISSNLEAIIKEVKQAQTQAEEALRNVDKNREIVEKCSNLIAEYDPVYKAQKESDERYSKLESEISAIKQMIGDLANKHV